MKTSIMLQVLSALMLVALCQAESTDKMCTLADVHNECFFGDYNKEIYNFFWRGERTIREVCSDRNRKDNIKMDFSCTYAYNRETRLCSADEDFKYDYSTWAAKMGNAVDYLCTNYPNVDYNCMDNKRKRAAHCKSEKNHEYSKDPMHRVCEEVDDLLDCYDDQDECSKNGEIVLKTLMDGLEPAYCTATFNMFNLFLILAALSITMFVSK